MQQRLIEKFSESIKVLNDYRNLYRAESSSTEQYKVANAINDILPKFCELIENDAEPVVHGHWVETQNRNFETGKWIETYVCSQCKRIIMLNEKENLKDFPYCHCGAKMDEEQEQE